MNKNFNGNRPNFIILALNCSSKADDIKALTYHGIQHFKAVEGTYNGSKEHSYVVTYNSIDKLQDIARLALKYNQESILVVDSNRDAELVYLQGSLKRTKLGKFKNITKHEALECNSYTYDPTNEYYYGVI